MTPPGGRRGLSPSAVLFLCLFASQAAILVLSPILPQVAAEFGVSTSTAAQLRAVSGITAAVAAFFVAARGGRFPLTRLLLLGLSLLGLGSLISAVAPSFAILLGAQTLIGVGLALVLSGGLAASDVWAHGEESAKVLSWALVGQPVAWIAGQPIVGWVAGVSWRWAWVAVPVASALIAIVAVTRLGADTADGPLECDPVGLWRTEGTRSWALGELAASAAWTGILVFAGAFFIEVHGASVGTTGLILGAVAAVYVPGNFLGRRLLRKTSEAVLLVSFAFASAVGAWLFGALQNGIAVSVIVFAGLAFFAGARTIAGAAMGLHLAGGRRLAAMSVRTSTLQLGYLIGTLVGGLVLPQFGFEGVWYVLGAIFALAGVVYLPRLVSRPVRARAPGVSFLRRG